MPTSPAQVESPEQGSSSVIVIAVVVSLVVVAALLLVLRQRERKKQDMDTVLLQTELNRAHDVFRQTYHAVFEAAYIARMFDPVFLFSPINIIR